MDGKTFLLTLVLGFLAMTVLGTYCGIPERGPIMAIAVAGGADRLGSSRRTRRSRDPPARE